MPKVFGKLIFVLFVVCGAALGQNQINPVTQIRWPLITGNGTPTATYVPCTAANYGQPYQNTAVVPNTRYHCGKESGTPTWELEPLAGVSSINSVTGAFTFTGSGVSCASTTCTFAGSSTLSFTNITAGTNTAPLLVGTGGTFGPAGTGVVTANAYTGVLGAANGGTGVSSLTGLRFANGTSADSSATSTQVQTAIGTGVYVPNGATYQWADLYPTGADECAKITNLAASLSGVPSTISTSVGVKYTCTNPIVLPLSITLDCNNSQIVWNPTSGPLFAIYSAGTPTTSPSNGVVRNCIATTPLNSSGIPVTTPSTTTTIGVFLGGDQTAGISPSTSWGAFETFQNDWFYGFNTAVEYGNNTWLLNLDHVRIAQGNIGITPQSGSLTNSGEKDVFVNGAIYNNSGAAFQGYNYGQQWVFAHSSLDYNGVAIDAVTGYAPFVELLASHIEGYSGCMVNLANSYRATFNSTDSDMYINAATGTITGAICNANSTSNIDLKAFGVSTGGATVNYAVYTGGVASTNLCMDAIPYNNGSAYLTPTDAVLANCGPDSFGASIARIIPTFVAPTGTTAYGLEVTQPTGGTANNEAINVIGGIQLSNVGESGGTGDLYALQAKNYGTGGIYVNLSAGVNYVSERFYGPTQTWGVGLFGNTTFCPAEDLTNLTSGAPTCILSVQPASPINSIAIGTGAVTVNDNLTVNNAGGSGGTSELDVTAHNLGTGATFITAQAGSDGYGALRTINGSQVWAMGALGGPDWILESYNGSLTRNVIDINSGAPASSLLITSGGSLSAYGGYAIQSNTVIPSTVTGYTGGSDTLVQLASGFGASGLLPMYDSAGGLMSSGAISYSSGGLVVNNVLNVANAGAGSGTGELDINATNYGAGGTYINAKTTANNYSAFRVFNGSNDWAIGNLGGLDLIFQHYNGTATNNVVDISASAPANSLNIAGGTGFASFVGGVSAASYSIGSNTVIPSTVTGYAGGSADTLVQLASGFGASGLLPMYDSAGGITTSSYLSSVPNVSVLNIAQVTYTGSTSTFGLKVNAGTGGTGTNYALDTENGDVLVNKNISGSDLNFQTHNYASGAGSYITAVANSNYAQLRELGSTQGWSEGMFGAGGAWQLADTTSGTYPIFVDIGAPTGSLNLSASGTLFGLAGTFTGLLASVGYANGAVEQGPVACSGSGSAYYTQDQQGSGMKHVLVRLASCNGNFSITYPTGFGYTPVFSTGSGTSAVAVSTISNTSASFSVVGTVTTEFELFGK